MKKNTEIWAIVALLLAVVFMSEIAVAQSNNILDGIVDTYKEQAKGWHSVIKSHAMTVFAYLAAINVSYSMAKIALSPGSTFNDFAASLLRLLFPILFFWTILMYSDEWLTAIIQSMRDVGGEASGVYGLSPSKIFDLGLLLVSQILEGSSSMGIADTIVLYLSSIIILVCFVMIAAIMLVAVVESYIVVSLGTMLLAFGSTQWTRDNATKQLMLAFSTGLKLMALQLIVGIGQSILTDFINKLGEASMSEIFVVMGSSMVLLILVQKIPDMLQSIVQGVSISASTEALNTASNIGSYMTGGASKAAEGIYSGTSALREAGKLATQQGASTPFSKASGAASALVKSFGKDIGDQLKGMPNTRYGNTLSRMQSDMESKRLEGEGGRYSGSIQPANSGTSEAKNRKPSNGYENTQVFMRKEP